MGKNNKIEVIVDANNADYKIQRSSISEEYLKKIIPLLEAIKKFKSYKTKRKGFVWEHKNNYPNGTYFPRADLGEKTLQELYPKIDEEVFEIFEELCPIGQHGFRNVVEVSILGKNKREVLLKSKEI